MGYGQEKKRLNFYFVLFLFFFERVDEASIYTRADHVHIVTIVLQHF